MLDLDWLEVINIFSDVKVVKSGFVREEVPQNMMRHSVVPKSCVSTSVFLDPECV